MWWTRAAISVPKRAEKLTARGVQAIQAPGLHADGDGLYLKVTASGARSWVYRYQLRKQRRAMGLGSLDTCSLATARQRANDARQLVADGVDPIEARKRQAVPLPDRAFRAMAKAYVTAMTQGWKNAKHAKQWGSTLDRYVYPTIGKVDVADVDTDHVLAILSPIWTAKPETASRVRGRIEAVLDYARARGWRMAENPARWRGHLSTMLPARAKVRPVRHFPAMPYLELPAWWPRLQVQSGIGARALELAILTVVRSDNVRTMTWPEIDFDQRTWTIPADKMKSPRNHRVPLSDPAIDLLRKMWTIRTGDLVFPGRRKARPMSDMTMLSVLRDMDLSYTPHGFRSTFKDWAAETTQHADFVVEMALAHKIATKLEAAYRRGDLFEKRRKLMDDWATYVVTQPV